MLLDKKASTSNPLGKLPISINMQDVTREENIDAVPQNATVIPKWKQQLDMNRKAASGAVLLNTPSGGDFAASAILPTNLAQVN